MNPKSLTMYVQLCNMLGKTYGVQDVTKTFTVAPSVQQELRDKIVEKSTFLGQINYLIVKNQEGQVILGGTNSRVASRTDTSGDGERKPKNVLGMDPKSYRCNKTNADVAISYDLIDAWTAIGPLAPRYTGWCHEQLANDKEVIGWHGQSVAATTDLVANPMLEDVNKGWMQYMRDNEPGNIIVEGVAASGVVKIGPGGDYENLDHAVADMKKLIPKHLRKGLKVFVGDELVGEEHARLMKAIGMDPEKKVLAQSAMSLIGGLEWETPSNFPERGLVITAPKNLSIYQQEGTVRRHLKDNPSKDQTEDYNSFNEAYVVEDTEALVALEFKDNNVKIPNAAGDGWE